MKRRIAFKPRSPGWTSQPLLWQISEPRVLNRAQQRLQRMSLFRLTWTPWKIVWKKPVDVFEQGESFWTQFAMKTPKSKSRGAKSAAVPKAFEPAMTIRRPQPNDEVMLAVPTTHKVWAQLHYLDTTGDYGRSAAATILEEALRARSLARMRGQSVI